MEGVAARLTLLIDANTAEEFFELASTALKRAKGEGKNRVAKLDVAVGHRVGESAGWLRSFPD